MDAELEDRVQGLFAGLAEDTRQQFVRVCSLSDYVRQSTLQHPDIVGELVDSGDLERQYEGKSLSIKI